MKIALVHDYLTSRGGAEEVLLSLHELFPQAPIYTLFSEINKNAFLKERFKNAGIIESWFARLPKHDWISPLRFLVPFLWAGFDFSDYDLILSSASWAITKGFALRQAQGKPKEICYCHTPPRYLYGYETSRNWRKHWYVRVYASIINHFLRQYDYNQAQKVTWFIANSQEVANRIKKFYRRESVVINPPVEIPEELEELEEKRGKRNFYLTGGRLEMPKNFDLIIQACNQLKLPLKVYGTGFQEKYLKALAGSTIEFLGSVSEKEKFDLMAGCRAFIVAGVDEDFGITPVEAMAAGRPVIAFRGGGYLETVVEGKTGVFFDEPTVKGVIGGVREMGKIGEKIKPEDCRKQAAKFSKERFKKEVQQFVEKAMQGI